MRDGNSAAEDGVVFNVVDSSRRSRSATSLVDNGGSGRREAYSSDAVCNMVTTLEMIAKLSGGT